MHTSDPPASAALVTGLRAEALRLGFSRLGIAPATPPPGQAGFHDWLARGLAGATHEWLARHEPLRADPRAAVDALGIARGTMGLIRQNLVWAFGYNVLMIPLAAGAAWPWTVALAGWAFALRGARRPQPGVAPLAGPR